MCVSVFQALPIIREAVSHQWLMCQSVTVKDLPYGTGAPPTHTHRHTNSTHTMGGLGRAKSRSSVVRVELSRFLIGIGRFGQPLTTSPVKKHWGKLSVIDFKSRLFYKRPRLLLVARRQSGTVVTFPNKPHQLPPSRCRLWLTPDIHVEAHRYGDSLRPRQPRLLSPSAPVSPLIKYFSIDSFLSALPQFVSSKLKVILKTLTRWNWDRRGGGQYVGECPAWRRRAHFF